MKTTKRILSLILAVIMLFSVGAISITAEDNSTELTDIIVGTSVGKAVQKLVSMGIINGYPDGTFRPDNTITRAEFCVVMVKFEGMQDYINADALTGFEDLDTDENYAWARPYVAMAVQLGIVGGFEDKTFRAADPVTYEQAIKMIVCSLGYGEKAQTPTIAGDWSSGYVAQAMRLRITNGISSSYLTSKQKPATRGTVAMLVANALDAEKADITTDAGDTILPGDNQGTNLGYEEIEGLVTGTYVTELYSGSSTVPRNHIMIDNDYYEIGFSADPNEFLGCQVKALVNANNEDGDYPIVTTLNIKNKSSVIEIEAGRVGDYKNGVLEYQLTRDGDWKEAAIDSKYTTIFNNKYYRYNIANIKRELKSGYVVLVDSNFDGKYDVIRINSYDVRVVVSKNSSSQKVTFMYGEAGKENSLIFPEETTSLIFSLTRNGKEISVSDIAKWDVLNIKESKDDAAGKKYYEVVVTRETVSGNITELDETNKHLVVIGNKEYYLSDDFANYNGEDKPNFDVGEYTQVYLDARGYIVAAAAATKDVSAEKYAYLIALRQESDESEYDLEFRFYSTDGKFIQLGSASRISIDGTRYKATDDNIKSYLQNTARQVTANAKDGVNVLYHQPVIYQTNSSGLISNMYTILSDNEDISVTKEQGKHFEEYSTRKYLGSKSFEDDFKISSSTKIIYIPQDRTDTDNYLIFKNYSKTFYTNRSYDIEAYGLSSTSSRTASMVIMYNHNDLKHYTSASPFMIVSSVSNTKDGTIITGYPGTSYKENTVKVSEENGPSVAGLDKGDVIRYIVDGSSELIDYKIWFDASDPKATGQHLPASNIDDAVKKRVLSASSSGDGTPTPQSTFRLQYGTVVDLILKEDDTNTQDDESIAVSASIVEDGVSNMVAVGTGVIDWTFSSSGVKVFYFDREGRNSEVLTDVDLSEIVVYDQNYPDDATRVIAYSTGQQLKMIYIVAD